MYEPLCSAVTHFHFFAVEKIVVIAPHLNRSGCSILQRHFSLWVTAANSSLSDRSLPGTAHEPMKNENGRICAQQHRTCNVKFLLLRCQEAR